MLTIKAIKRLCRCCFDVWVDNGRACDACSKAVCCEGCLTHVGPTFAIPEGWVCCSCKGDPHDPPSNAELAELKADIAYHSLKDEGKLG